MDKIQYQGRFLELRATASGWEYCARVNDAAAAMIFARTPDGSILLVEEFRPPIGAQSICFPAGLCGDQGPEKEATAARRELLEETGYEAGEIELLFRGPSSPGLSSEQIAFYLATDLRRLHVGGGVDGENIIVHEIAESEIESWLAQQMQAGKSIDPRVYTGLYFLQRGLDKV